MSNEKHDVTRRQFLNYTLTGVGGFMAAGMLMPMVRFAVDPLLKEDKETKFVQVDMKESDVTETPVKKTLTRDVVDGWHEFEEEKTAYILKGEDGGILALSPICTHLGCTVGWEASGHANHFYCPCHGGTYTKYGVNLPGTPPPAPLHAYEVKVKDDGYIYLGEAKPRGGA
ncbi:ubiquinol-cytochrome c reductase iron-sulfur subunit [Tuberibacillus sp. Marseille-P3662]|uniref:ubiquinol-cytochrome c reductase iron-sulfur subunit n=1 Tax=Tuberibacillus sp. Marseille-P3662 TaxID=1965358 RepID=UPI000A1C98F6|nr:ubiquinol-cytochrome c reductase iron-sulfur subunit [Tuberibacillus sp. Marseille-P3662]